MTMPNISWMVKKMIRKIKNRLKEYEQLRKVKQKVDILKLKTKNKFGNERLDIDREIIRIKRTYYLAYFMEFLCNFNCSYCIQDKISRNEYERIDVNRVIDYLKTEAKPKESCLAIVGGEVTINPHFEYVIESLCKEFYITVTTNLGSRFYKDFDKFLKWAKKNRLLWNTSYHHEFMDVDLYIQRIRAMKNAGLEVGQVTSVKSSFLPMEDREKLESANIGFEYQTFFGIDEKTGELLPKTWGHPDFDYERYKKMCGKQYKKTCQCRTTVCSGQARHLIAPDGRIYNCHHLLYTQKHPIGHLGWPEDLLEPIECTEYGHCNPCDIFAMEIVSVLN